MMKHWAVYISVAVVLLSPTGWAGERIVPSVARDIELMKNAASSLGAQAVGRLDKLAAKYHDSKDKDSVEKQIEAYKRELLTNDAFLKAYRKALRKEFKITDMAIEKSSKANREAVDAEVKDAISTSLNDRYPFSLLQQTKEKAVKAFPCYKVGDQASVIVNGRRISGRINAMNSEAAMIGFTRIPMRDLNPKFDPGKMQKVRDKYVKEQYHDKRNAYQKKLHETIPPQIYGKYGFVRHRDDWLPARELAERIDAALEVKAGEGKKQVVHKAKVMSRLKTTAIIGGGAVVLLLIVAVTIRLMTGRR